ncbi:MAG: (d)CMP kinase [Pirellulales bacterium]
MIVTIDGPAGAGKSTLAPALADRLGFRFLDTGAMYRAIARELLDRQLRFDDPAAIAEMAQTVKLHVEGSSIFVDGRDVSTLIRKPEVNAVIHHVADNPRVRAMLRQAQREYAERGSLVTEGRDQGTAVFPDAECKIYLTASAEERARRRYHELRERGEAASFEDVLAAQNERDARDQARSDGRLMAAPDAVEICTDGLTTEAVLDRIEQIVRQRLSK